MPYNAESILYEKEVINIIKKGQELQRLDLTVADNMLNNYFHYFDYYQSFHIYF